MIDLDISTPATTLNDVKAAFSYWRKTRAKRDRIPEALWDQVLSLGNRYSESKILNTPVSHNRSCTRSGHDAAN